MTEDDRIALLVLNGLDDEQIHSAAREQLGMKPPAIDSAIKAARRKITLAADFRRDEQLGLAIRRLHHCYATAHSVGDVKAAIGAQKALNGLLNLARMPAISDSADESLSEYVQAHLGPHIPEAEGDVYELIRLAALRLTDG